MKPFIYFLLACTLVGCNNTSPVDLEKATQEANDFIANQFDFFTKSSMEIAKSTFSVTLEMLFW